MHFDGVAADAQHRVVVVAVEAVAGGGGGAAVLVPGVAHAELFVQGGEGEGEEVDDLAAVDVDDAEGLAFLDREGAAVAAFDEDVGGGVRGGVGPAVCCLEGHLGGGDAGVGVDAAAAAEAAAERAVGEMGACH